MVLAVLPPADDVEVQPDGRDELLGRPVLIDVEHDRPGGVEDARQRVEERAPPEAKFTIEDAYSLRQ